MTDDEMITSAIEAFDGKLVAYWKLKNPPNYEEMEESFKNRKPVEKDEAHLVDKIRRNYWERRAKDICERPSITKNEVRTAMCGVSHNSNMVAQLKAQLARAK